MLVVKADAYEARALEQFVARLGLDGGKVRGAVLTGAETA